MMIDNEVSFTSLCYITVDYEGRIWLNRLADVEDDILHTPFKSERTDNYFENSIAGLCDMILHQKRPKSLQE